MARNAVLLKPNVANILLFNFCEQKFVQHDPITIAIDCNGLSFLSKKNGPIIPLDQNPQTNSDSFWVRRLFNACVRVFCDPNATILFVYIPAKIKMSFTWQDASFFFAKIGKVAAVFPICSSVYTTIFVRRTRFCCVGFSMYGCGFSVVQMRQFCLFTYPPRKDDFFCQNRHLL